MNIEVRRARLHVMCALRWRDAIEAHALDAECDAELDIERATIKNLKRYAEGKRLADALDERIAARIRALARACGVRAPTVRTK